MAINARLPPACSPATGAAPEFNGRAWVSQWLVTCTDPLEGTQTVIDELENTQTDVLIRVQNPERAMITSRVIADTPCLLIPDQPSRLVVFWQYFVPCWEHILEGLDHLLFVFVLLVLVQSPGRLADAITAFTVAHSITLAAASMGVLSVPSPPVDAAIALSIVLLAVKILKQGEGKSQLTASYPWIVAFLFGLLHGLGFAGGLSEIGLPEGDIPLALLAFNLGVEAGQPTFVASVLLVLFVLRQIGLAMATAVHSPGGPGIPWAMLLAVFRRSGRPNGSPVSDRQRQTIRVARGKGCGSRRSLLCDRNFARRREATQEPPCDAQAGRRSAAAVPCISVKLSIRWSAAQMAWARC